MDLIKIIILGVVQGLTEFLPISSSGHLVIFKSLLNFVQDDLFIEIILHFGTLISIIIYFRLEIVRQILDLKAGKRDYFYFLCVASIPAAIVGVFFKDMIESIISLQIVSMFLILNAFILFYSRHKVENRKNISFLNSFLIGLVQACALFPGISRSGITITAAMLLGIDRKQAAQFSLFLAMPIILGANLLSVYDNFHTLEYSLSSLLIGISVSALTGYFAIGLLYQMVKNNRFWIFGVYCFIFGIINIFLSL